MFQFSACPLPGLCVQPGVPGHCSKRVAPFGNPRIARLLAATRGLSQQRYVLHRLLVPRHPPCALTILTVIFLGENSAWPRACTLGHGSFSPGDTRYIGYCAVFKVREEAERTRGSSGLGPQAAGGRRSLKTQQHASRTQAGGLVVRRSRFGRHV